MDMLKDKKIKLRALEPTDLDILYEITSWLYPSSIGDKYAFSP